MDEYTRETKAKYRKWMSGGIHISIHTTSFFLLMVDVLRNSNTFVLQCDGLGFLFV